MTLFSGFIGFANQEETAPGVWEDHIIEKACRGEILQNQNRWQTNNEVNDNFQLDNKFSIILNAYLQSNWAKIRYIKWKETSWKVSKVELKHPRIIITTGGIYNGQTP